MSSRHTQNFHEEMNGFKIRKFVVTRVYAKAEEETGVTPVHDLVVAELRRNIQSNQSFRVEHM